MIGARSYEKGLQEVGDGVWAYLQPDGSWGWSNSGLVSGGDASLLVDTLFDLMLTTEMLETIRRAVPAARRIDTVVNTHANGDHCYGNQLLAGAEIVASRRCAEEMAEVPPDRLTLLMDAAPTLGQLGEYLTRIFGSFHFDGISLTLPTRTFDGELTLHVGDREVRLIEVGPAHTRGDVLVHLPAERVVFTGDILFVGGHPIMWSGPVGNWIGALDRISGLDVEVVVPGHGPLADTTAVGEMKAYFEWLRQEARGRFDTGMAPFEAACDLSLDQYNHWGEAERVVANIAALYREFSGAGAGGDFLAVASDMARFAAQFGGGSV